MVITSHRLLCTLCVSARGFLPFSWDAAAQVPDGRKFQTKPQLLRSMMEQSVVAGIPFSWVPADEAYGDNGPLRAFFEEEGIAYVLAVSRDHMVATPAGPDRADILAKAGAWHRLSCVNGAKGRRWYDWALFATTRPEISLLVRRPPAGHRGTWARPSSCCNLNEKFLGGLQRWCWTVRLVSSCCWMSAWTGR